MLICHRAISSCRKILKWELKIGFILSITTSSLYTLGKPRNHPRLPFLYIKIIIINLKEGIGLDSMIMTMIASLGAYYVPGTLVSTFHLLTH